MATAKDVMETDLITLSENTPIYRAMRILVDNGISGAPVVGENTRLLGIVSEKDMLQVLYSPHLGDGLVMDIMSTNLVCFEEDDDLVDIVEVMIEGRFRRVPIVRGEKIIGLITRTDIMRHILETRYSHV